MKKRLVSVFVAMTVVSCMATGCGKEVSQTTDAQTQVQTETSKEETKTEEAPVEVKEERKAEEVSESDFSVYDLEDGTVGIDSYKGEATDIIVPDTIDGKTVTELRNLNGKVTSVVLPDSIVKICDKAFLNCHDLQSIEFGNGLKEIGVEAFENCGTLKEAIIPDSVEIIGDAAFVCSGIENVHIPTGINDLVGTFSNAQFQKVTVPGNVKLITDQAFYMCPNLEEVILEDGVEVIGDDAFRMCTELKRIYIPASVTEINEYLSFANCPEDMVIVTPAGSYAESFAIENEIPYENQ